MVTVKVRKSMVEVPACAGLNKVSGLWALVENLNQTIICKCERVAELVNKTLIPVSCIFPTALLDNENPVIEAIRGLHDCFSSQQSLKRLVCP